MQSPATAGLLQAKLDEIIGAGKYELKIAEDVFEIRIETAAADAHWYHEIYATVSAMKPANMVFVTLPLLGNRHPRWRKRQHAG